MLDCEKNYDESKTDDIENVKGGDAESEDTKGGDSSGRVADCQNAEGGKTESDVATIENQESWTEIAERNLDCIYDDDYFFFDAYDNRTYLVLANVGVAMFAVVVVYVLVDFFKSY
ncbi:uncharacterized protein LOC143453478 isoform X2 [Clavelina lepadiformis]|uniref:Uncharacterized protein n=1 Tax=Clavelina lepadiformis TaxID=159417 RepID=A0ABP0GV56_CLALP